MEHSNTKSELFQQQYKLLVIFKLKLMLGIVHLKSNVNNLCQEQQRFHGGKVRVIDKL